MDWPTERVTSVMIGNVRCTCPSSIEQRSSRSASGIKIYRNGIGEIAQFGRRALRPPRVCTITTAAVAPGGRVYRVWTKVGGGRAVQVSGARKLQRNRWQAAYAMRAVRDGVPPENRGTW
jgi:hypothetical protein